MPERPGRAAHEARRLSRRADQFPVQGQGSRGEADPAAVVRGVEMLVGEMHAFRAGEKDTAFARIARPDEEADLLRKEADVALYYPCSGAEVGKLLGFIASQIDMLLGSHGLGWAGDDDHQGMTRWKDGCTRFWHKDVPTKLAETLLNREPEAFRVVSKQVRSMFAAFKARQRPARRG